MDDFRPGDIKIEQCLLKSKDGKREYDIRLQARHIDIYESLTQPFFYGEIILADGIGLLRGFPIIGEETLQFTFSTPSLKSKELDLRVYNICDIADTDNKKLKIYTLKVCSPELLTNATKLISKRYKGNISDTVKKIVKDHLGSNKKVTVEKTKGIDDHLLSQVTPLQAIDKYRHRAVSAQYLSSSYVFYEDATGYNFVTLEKLIKEGKKKVADKVYFYDDNLDIEQAQVRFRDIIDMKELVDQNSLNKLQAGALKNVVKKYDLMTGEVKEVTFDSAQGDSLFQPTADKLKNNSSKFKQEYGKTTSKNFLVPFTSATNEEDHIGEKVGTLHAFVEKIAQNIVLILIYGDSTVKLGDIIACNYTTSNALSKDKEVKTVSYNYLISKIRHQITISDRPIYLQSLELLNSSYDY
jgi:hypothetical protein